MLLEGLPLEINVFAVISARRRLETTWFSSIIPLKNYIWHNQKHYFLAAESSCIFWEIRDYRSDDLLLRPVPKGLTVGFKDFVAPRTDQLDWPPVRTNIPCILGRVIGYPIIICDGMFIFGWPCGAKMSHFKLRFPTRTMPPPRNFSNYHNYPKSFRPQKAVGTETKGRSVGRGINRGDLIPQQLLVI